MTLETSLIALLFTYAALITLLVRYLWRKWNEAVKEAVYARVVNVELAAQNEALRRMNKTFMRCEGLQSEWPEIVE